MNNLNVFNYAHSSSYIKLQACKTFTNGCFNLLVFCKIVEDTSRLHILPFRVSIFVPEPLHTPRHAIAHAHTTIFICALIQYAVSLVVYRVELHYKMQELVSIKYRLRTTSSIVLYIGVAKCFQ